MLHLNIFHRSLSCFHLTLKTVAFLALTTSSTHALAKDQSFHYGLHTAMRYGDKLINPTSSIASPSMIPMLKQDSRRAFGLSKSRFLLGWSSQDKVHFNIVLRPDYSLYSEGVEPLREFDSRAGTVFRQPNTLKLLDAYDVKFKAGESFYFRAGVFETMAPVVMSYEPYLEFGLNVRLPRRFSALSLSWNVGKENFPTAQPATVLGHEMILMVYQGQDDRNDHFTYESSTNDRSPTSRDPHKGISFQYKWRASPSFFMDALVGYRDDKEAPGQKRNDLIARFAWQYNFESFGLPMEISHDLRHNRLRSTGGMQNTPKTLNQASTSFTGVAWFKPTLGFYTGFHYGLSEHHLPASPKDAMLFRGWQADLGVKRIFHEDLVASFTTAYETRERDLLGQVTGGFSDGNSPKTKIARFVLQIDYMFSGS